VPELPEVETLRRSLEGLIRNRPIASAKLHRRDILILPGDPEGGFSRSRTKSKPKRVTQRHLLAGGSITQLLRRGKQLALIADDGRTLIVHLGMTGQLRFLPPGAAPDKANHIHITWTFLDGARLFFRDPRRFGGIWSLPTTDALTARWQSLGPDAASITGPALAAAAASSRRAIKAVLLDQQALAGVGNIYADEALHLARISPRRSAHRLAAAEYDSLATAIRTILAAAIAARGSTLRDYRDATNQPGEAQLAHRVYGRAKQPCLTCGKPLRTTRLAQRATVWCSSCQT
jgi:formamidopyrimidine-DNA glycosylase